MAASQFSAQAQRDIKRKLRILVEAEQCGNVSFTCRRFGISRDTFIDGNASTRRKVKLRL